MPTADDRIRPVDEEALGVIRGLLAGARVCSLATTDEHGPYAALAAFAVDAETGTLLVHLSDLALHKRQLIADPRVAVLIARPDDGRTEILQHPRLVLRCAAARISKMTAGHADARRTYLERHPRHAVTFGLADFDLFRLTPESGLLNAGFGRAYAVLPLDVLTATRPEPPAA